MGKRGIVLYILLSTLCVHTLIGQSTTGDKLFRLDISEACQGEEPIALIGHLIDSLQTPLPSGGIYAIENCLNVPCNQSAIFLNDSLGTYFFDPQVEEDSYIISYTVGSSPFKTKYISQFDLQAANSQIITFSEGVCPGEQALLQANPKGGTFSGIGLDSFKIGNEYNFAFNPEGLVTDSTYRIDYNYSLTGASGLVCTDSSSIELKVFEGISLSFEQDSIEECHLHGVNVDVMVSNEAILAELSWFNSDFELLSTESVFATDTITCSSDFYVYAIDIYGCEDLATFHIAIIQPPVISCEIISTVNCYGDPGASLLVASDNPETLSYLWSDGDTSAVRSNLTAGIYELVTTDERGCSSSCSVTIDQPEILEIKCEDNLTKPTCYEGSDGINNIEITGGTPPYSISLDSITFSTDTELTGLSPSPYTVYVIDDNDCMQQCNFIIPETEQDSCEVQILSNISCYGDSTSQLSVQSTLDLSIATIEWNTGANTPVLENLSSGTYIATLISEEGCAHTCQIEIEQPQELALGLLIYNEPNCHLGADGEISVRAEGGTSPYRYHLSDSIQNMTGDFSGLSSGNYQLTIVDDNGCEMHKHIELSDPVTITADLITDTTLACAGDTNGRLELINLNQEVNFLWSTGDTTAYIQQLAAGDYFVTLTNTNGCQQIFSTKLSEPLPLSYSINSIDHNDCNNGNQGAIELLATGGTPPYAFAWNNGDTLQQIDRLIAGNYTVTLSDDNGCQETTTFTITEPTPVVATFNTTEPSCHTSKDGHLELSLSPAYPNAVYLWNTGDTTSGLTVSAGSYQVTVTTVPNCTIVFETEVVAPTALSIELSSYLPVLCYGETTGEATIAINGGIAPYEILWADGSFGLTRNNLATGEYHLTVMDTNGCQMVESFMMLGPEKPVIDLQSQNSLCHASPTGSLSIQSNIDLATSSIKWNDGSSEIERRDLMAGDYAVTVTDILGCETTAQTTLTDPDSLFSIADIKNINCYLEATGEISLSVSGGTPPIDVLWSDGQATLDRTNLIAGEYSVSLTDANNCILNETYTVLQNPEFTLEAQDVISCLDEEISLTITVNGRASETLNYEWTLTSSDLAVSEQLILEQENNELVINTCHLPPGTMTLLCEARDNNGCIATTSLAIELENCFDLALQKKVQGSELKSPDDPFIFEIEVFNQGTVTAYNLVIEDKYDTDLQFIPTKNTAALTGNPSDWIQQNNSVTTKIDSLLPGESRLLSIYFDLSASPQTSVFCNEAEIISYANRNKLLPLDQDDNLLLPAVELDDDIADESTGGADNPYDDDQKDKATVRICPNYQHSIEMNLCGEPDNNILLDPTLMNALDPDGDGDGDTTDGDVGNLITSFHQTLEAALSNVEPIQSMDFNLENIYARLTTQEGCISSVALALQINEVPEPRILAEEIYISLGDTIELSIEKRDDENYQWQEKLNGQYVNILGATGYQYFLPITSLDQNNSEYRVEVTLEHETISCAQASSEARLIIPSVPPACKNRLNVSLDNNCGLYLTPSQLTNGLYSDEIYTITYSDHQGNTVTDEWQNHIDEGLIFTVTNTFTQTSCWGNISLRDLSPPRITCPTDLTLSCVDTLDYSLFVAKDNCGESDLTITKQSPIRDCTPDMDNVVSVQQIEISATDAYGNQSPPCITQLHLTTLELDSLVIPADTILQGTLWDLNSNDYPEPLESGQFLYDSLSFSFITDTLSCQLDITYSDIVIELGSDDYFLERTWFIVNLCDGTTRIAAQKITVRGDNFKDSKEGKFRFRETISAIKPSQTNGANLNCKVFPNPFEKETLLTFELTYEQEVQIDLYNIQGKSYYSERQVYAKGKHRVTLESNLFIDETSLYILIITSPDLRETIPIVHSQ